jgi:hypothetical protein
MISMKIVAFGIAFTALSLGAPTLRADESGMPRSFGSNAWHLKGVTPKPLARSALNPQPLPPKPGDPEEKSGIIIIGGKTKPAKPPLARPELAAPPAHDAGN